MSEYEQLSIFDVQQFQNSEFILTLAQDIKGVRQRFGSAREDQAANRRHSPQAIRKSVLFMNEAIKMLCRAVEVPEAEIIWGESSSMNPMWTPKQANLTYYDLVVLSAVYAHLLIDRIDMVISLRELYRVMSQKHGGAALLSRNHKERMINSLAKLSKCYVNIKVSSVSRSLPLLPAWVGEQIVSGHTTSAIAIKKLPQFLLYTMQEGWLAVDTIPYYKSKLNATDKMLDIAYMIESSVVSYYRMMASSKHLPLSLELKYQDIYDVAFIGAIGNHSTYNKASPTQTARVRACVKNILDSLVCQGSIVGWHQDKNGRRIRKDTVVIELLPEVTLSETL